MKMQLASLSRIKDGAKAAPIESIGIGLSPPTVRSPGGRQEVMVQTDSLLDLNSEPEVPGGRGLQLMIAGVPRVSHHNAGSGPEKELLGANNSYSSEVSDGASGFLHPRGVDTFEPELFRRAGDRIMIRGEDNLDQPGDQYRDQLRDGHCNLEVGHDGGGQAGLAAEAGAKQQKRANSKKRIDEHIIGKSNYDDLIEKTRQRSLEARVNEQRTPTLHKKNSPLYRFQYLQFSSRGKPNEMQQYEQLMHKKQTEEQEEIQKKLEHSESQKRLLELRKIRRLQYSARRQSSVKDLLSAGSRVSLGKQAQHRTLDTNNDSQEEHDLVVEAPILTKDFSMRSISPKYQAPARLSTSDMMGVNRHQAILHTPVADLQLKKKQMFIHNPDYSAYTPNPITMPIQKIKIKPRISNLAPSSPSSQQLIHNIDTNQSPQMSGYPSDNNSASFIQDHHSQLAKGHSGTGSRIKLNEVFMNQRKLQRTMDRELENRHKLVAAAENNQHSQRKSASRNYSSMLQSAHERDDQEVGQKHFHRRIGSIDERYQMIQEKYVNKFKRNSSSHGGSNNYALQLQFEPQKYKNRMAGDGLGLLATKQPDDPHFEKRSQIYHQKMQMLQKHRIKRQRQSEVVTNRKSSLSEISLQAQIDNNVYIFENKVTQSLLRNLNMVKDQSSQKKLLMDQQLQSIKTRSLLLDGNKIDGQLIDKLVSLGLPVNSADQEKLRQASQCEEQVERDRQLLQSIKQILRQEAKRMPRGNHHSRKLLQLPDHQMLEITKNLIGDRVQKRDQAVQEDEVSDRDEVDEVSEAEEVGKIVQGSLGLVASRPEKELISQSPRSGGSPTSILNTRILHSPKLSPPELQSRPRINIAAIMSSEPSRENQRINAGHQSLNQTKQTIIKENSQEPIDELNADDLIPEHHSLGRNQFTKIINDTPQENVSIVHSQSRNDCQPRNDSQQKRKISLEFDINSQLKFSKSPSQVPYQRSENSALRPNHPDDRGNLPIFQHHYGPQEHTIEDSHTFDHPRGGTIQRANAAPAHHNINRSASSAAASAHDKMSSQNSQRALNKHKKVKRNKSTLKEYKQRSMSVSKPQHVVPKQFKMADGVAGEIRVADEGDTHPDHTILRRSESLQNQQPFIKIGDEMEHEILDIQVRDENGRLVGQDFNGQANRSQGPHHQEQTAMISQADQGSALSDIENESPFMQKQYISNANFGDSPIVLNVQKVGRPQHAAHSESHLDRIQSQLAQSSNAVMTPPLFAPQYFERPQKYKIQGFLGRVSSFAKKYEQGSQKHRQQLVGLYKQQRLQARERQRSQLDERMVDVDQYRSYLRHRVVQNADLNRLALSTMLFSTHKMNETLVHHPLVSKRVSAIQLQDNIDSTSRGQQVEPMDVDLDNLGSQEATFGGLDRIKELPKHPDAKRMSEESLQDRREMDAAAPGREEETCLTFKPALQTTKDRLPFGGSMKRNTMMKMPMDSQLQFAMSSQQTHADPDKMKQQKDLSDQLLWMIKQTQPLQMTHQMHLMMKKGNKYRIPVMKISSDLRQGSLRSSSQQFVYDPYKQTEFRSGQMHLSERSIERGEGSQIEEQHGTQAAKNKQQKSHMASQDEVENADLSENTASKSQLNQDPQDPYRIGMQLVVAEENQMAEQTAEGDEQSANLEKPLTPLRQVGHLNQNLSISAQSKTERQKRKKCNKNPTSGSCTPTDRHDAAKQSSAGAFTLSQKDAINQEMDKKEDSTTFNLDGVLSVTRQKKINNLDVENEHKPAELLKQPDQKSPRSPASLHGGIGRVYKRSNLGRAGQAASVLLQQENKNKININIDFEGINHKMTSRKQSQSSQHSPKNIGQTQKSIQAQLSMSDDSQSGGRFTKPRRYHLYRDKNSLLKDVNEAHLEKYKSYLQAKKDRESKVANQRAAQPPNGPPQRRLAQSDKHDTAQIAQPKQPGQKQHVLVHHFALNQLNPETQGSFDKQQILLNRKIFSTINPQITSTTKVDQFMYPHVMLKNQSRKNLPITALDNRFLDLTTPGQHLKAKREVPHRQEAGIVPPIFSAKLKRAHSGANQKKALSVRKRSMGARLQEQGTKEVPTADSLENQLNIQSIGKTRSPSVAQTAEMMSRPWRAETLRSILQQDQLQIMQLQDKMNDIQQRIHQARHHFAVPGAHELVAAPLTRQSHLNYGIVSPSSPMHTPIRGEGMPEKKTSGTSLHSIRREYHPAVRFLDGSTQIQENFILNSDLYILADVPSPTPGRFRDASDQLDPLPSPVRPDTQLIDHIDAGPQETVDGRTPATRLVKDSHSDGHGRPQEAISEMGAKEKNQTRINDTFGKSGGWREVHIDKTLPLTLSQGGAPHAAPAAKAEGLTVTRRASAD